MKTTDFSRAPRIGQATYEFVGATSFAGPLAMLRLGPRWLRMILRARRSPGYCGSRVFYEFPFTLGTIAFFRDRDSLMRFARSVEHASLMTWVMRPENARGGFIRLYQAEELGYSSGIWRAEPPHALRHIPRFSPVAGEERGPRVTDLADE